MNGFGHRQRLALWQALFEAETDPAVPGVVLSHRGALFGGGADIREFDSPTAEAVLNLHDLIERLPGLARRLDPLCRPDRPAEGVRQAARRAAIVARPGRQRRACSRWRWTAAGSTTDALIGAWFARCFNAGRNDS